MSTILDRKKLERPGKDTESETINLPNKKNTVKHLMPTSKEMG